MLPQFINTITDQYEAYKKWVSENPQFVADIETTIKFASYFIAGRMNTSSIISELIYSWSNLLVLFNDRIIKNSLCRYMPTNDTKTKLKLLLTIIEYCEVFIELSAKQVWSEFGRWFFICAVQFIKCIFRLLLTYRYEETIIESPPIKQINRKDTEEMIKNGSVDIGNQSLSSTFVLKRSKRIIRCIDGSSPIYLRNFKSMSSDTIATAAIDPMDRPAIPLAESIYIFKPLIHLASIYRFGYNSWKSYTIALLLDSFSLYLYHNKRYVLSQTQKRELAKRCVSLLLYLMRSPFYEKLSKNKINGILNGFGKTIPLAHMICNPLLTYIPLWQTTYFYMWST